MDTPVWVQDSVFYEIFLDRFANGDTSNDPPNVKAWGEPPTQFGFQGGDLPGITQKLDYLMDLGINALYLTPIFLSTSTHRYNITDYYKIDPKLGTLKDFRTLLDRAHSSHIRVVLDGVFNHCGRGFFAFVDVLENNEHSPYKDWFHIKKFPVQAYGGGEANTYAGWWNHKSLPKLNTANSEVRRYIFNVARHWIEQGADGWRLDVPNEIDDDSFWGELRDAVKSVNPEAYLLGEIWTIDPRWTSGKHFDGLMNYPAREALLALLTNKESPAQFADRIDQIFDAYQRENLLAMYLPLGSHDTQRIMSVLGGDLRKVKLAFLIQFSLPGAPAIYYGDEVGLEGYKDPDNRRAFPWDTTHWNSDLRSWVKQLIGLRKSQPALCRGDYQRLLAEGAVLAFGRLLNDQGIITVINFDSNTRKIEVPVSQSGWQEEKDALDLFDHTPYTIENGRAIVPLEPNTGTWITTRNAIGQT